MGDLNTGPYHVWNETYQELENAGYTSANVDSFCTFCPDENLINHYNDDRNIDHVQVRNAETSNPQRNMDEMITLTLENGETIEAHLSDHFGYQATVTYQEGSHRPDEKCFIKDKEECEAADRCIYKPANHFRREHCMYIPPHML